MDIYENELENEGEINIPRITTHPAKFLDDKKLQKPLLKLNSLRLDNKLISSSKNDNYLNPYDKFNLTERINKYKINLKNDDLNSATTKFSMGSVNDKIKKVTFSTVEIIRIENYKKYNKINTIKKNEENISINESNCTIF